MHDASVTSYLNFDPCGHYDWSERQGMRADRRDENAGDAGVDHGGPGTHSVGRTARRRGDNQTWK